MLNTNFCFALFVAPASPPLNVAATVLSSTKIQVNWTEVLEIDRNGIIIQYQVMYEPLKTFGVLTKLAVNTTSLSLTLMDLEECVEYKISVRAYTSVGPGPYSVGIVYKTFEDGKSYVDVYTKHFIEFCFFAVPMSHPENVSVSVIDSRSIQVDWTEVLEIDQNGIITEYEVMYEPLMTFGGLITTLTVNTTNLSITLMDLEEYVEYNISVRAYTSVGPGPYSAGIIRQTIEDGECNLCSA